MSSMFDKIHAKAHKVKQKIQDEVDDLQTDMSRLGVAIKTTWNVNHRHDEEHEQEEDRKRQEIMDQHRFKSFTVPRDGNDVKWYIDGHDYFWALSEALEQARETIWICDWWLSPELYLRRPPAQNEQWRLDRILKRKAEQGVKIFVQVYKEVNVSMTMNSKYTKHALEDLHRNIACIRHPDHSGGELVYYWSHHEKIVVIDSAIACIGGLDLCYGRWDTHNFPLADLHPENQRNMVYVGQDYNDARVADFENVQAWAGNQHARTAMGRMPWHDLHSMLIGPAVIDIAQHFIERWNFTCDLKYKHQGRYPVLDWPVDDPLEHRLSQHPHTSHLRQFGHRYRPHMVHFDSRVQGNTTVQVVRSVGDWSIGFNVEHSIQNAYVEMIREAEHFIFIENQFFVTWPSPKGPVRNGIAAALVERILRAAREQQKFKVVVVIPEVPCFAGDLSANAGILAIMDAQYKSIARGPDSIYGKISAAGFNPYDYINFYNLRQYDRIKYDPQIFEQMERQSGVTWPQVQAAMARLHIGDNDVPELERENNQTLRFRAPIYNEAITTGEPMKDAKGKEASQTIPIPATIYEAEQIIAKFEAAAPLEYRSIAASISRNTLQSGRTIWDEAWCGSEAAEKAAYVSEELYIHSKAMIVDDRRCIIGSANINERSQAGDRDSEIAIVIEDRDMIQSAMNGQPYSVSRFASTYRRQIFRQHLGLIRPQDCDGQIHSAMLPVGMPHGSNEYDFGSAEDAVVADPLSNSLEQMWRSNASTNSAIYTELFHPVPAAGIKNWAQYKSFVQTSKTVGHLANRDTVDLQYVKSQLGRIKGHLVDMPLDFMVETGLLSLTAEVNPVTLPIYM